MAKSDGESKLWKEFLALVGPALPNVFEERFAYQLHLGKLPRDAYRVAGYAITGKYEERAGMLAKSERICRRQRDFQTAGTILSLQYGDALRAFNILEPTIDRGSWIEKGAELNDN